MRYIVVDFETYFDSEAGLTLRKQPIPEHLGDERFKVHCLGVTYDGKTKVLWGDDEIREWLRAWDDVEDYCFVAHNGYFDFAIMAWRYDFVPRHMSDTLLLANHVLGSAIDSGSSNALAALAERLGLENKKKLDFMDGVRDPDEAQRKALEMYLATDLLLTQQVFDTLLPHVTNADVELWLLDLTLRIYATRPLDLNFEVVDRAERLINERAEEALKRLEGIRKWPDGYDLRAMLSSDKAFTAVLAEELHRYGQPMPTKARPVTPVERKRWEKKRAEIALAESGKPPAEVLAKGNRSIAAWERWAERTLAESYKVPEELGDTVHIPAVSKQDDGFIRLSFSPFEGLAALVSARLVLKSSTTSMARITKMRQVAGGGVRKMPIHLVYYGAHTGRWSGGGGFNFQNLTSPDRASDPGQKAIAGAIREAFEAPPGGVFVYADASQIEARVSAWITGEWKLLDRFARKEDVYSSFISEVLGREIRKPLPSDPPEVASDMKIMRHVGKEAVLGLGYSMGYRKFVARLKSNPDVANLFYDGTFDESFAKRVVEAYRESNAKIVEGWRSIQNAFFMAVRGGRKQVGPLSFAPGKPLGSRLPVVDVTLPSGRVLHYRNIQRVTAKNREGFEWKHGGGQRLYGGLLLENITQATARDIIVESIVRAETEMDMRIVLNVHDSIVGLAPEAEAEKKLEQLIASLRTNPEWAGRRLVLDAEGATGRTLKA